MRDQDPPGITAMKETESDTDRQRRKNKRCPLDDLREHRIRAVRQAERSNEHGIGQ